MTTTAGKPLAQQPRWTCFNRTDIAAVTAALTGTRIHVTNPTPGGAWTLTGHAVLTPNGLKLSEATLTSGTDDHNVHVVDPSYLHTILAALRAHHLAAHRMPILGLPHADTRRIPPFTHAFWQTPTADLGITFRWSPTYHHLGIAANITAPDSGHRHARIAIPDGRTLTHTDVIRSLAAEHVRSLNRQGTR